MRGRLRERFQSRGGRSERRRTGVKSSVIRRDGEYNKSSRLTAWNPLKLSHISPTWNRLTSTF